MIYDVMRHPAIVCKGIRKKAGGGAQCAPYNEHLQAVCTIQVVCTIQSQFKVLDIDKKQTEGETKEDKHEV